MAAHHDFSWFQFISINHNFVTEQKEFVHPALAESNIKYQELQWRKISYFIMNGITHENGKLMLKKP